MKRVLTALRVPLITLILLLFLLSAPSILHRTSDELRLDPSAPIAIARQLFEELSTGDFLRYTAGKTEHSITAVLPEALTISWLFLLSAGFISLLSAVLLGIVLPDRSGIWRELAGLLAVVPDFLLVLILQLGVVVIARTTGLSIARTAWISSSRPALLLPIISMSLLASVYLTRIAVSERRLIENGGYVQFARARGIGERRILMRHVLPGILVAFRRELMKALSIILGNLFIIEHLFNIPGITRFMFRYVFLADNDYFSYSRRLVTQVDVGMISLVAVILLFTAAFTLLRGILNLTLRGLQA